MDIISFDCARRHFNYFFRICSGFHWEKSYVYNFNTQKFEVCDYNALSSETQLPAPNWEELRVCLKQTNPSAYILSKFEAIDNIDDYADKLVERITEMQVEERL